MDLTLKDFYKYLDEISYRGVRPSLDRIGEAVAILGNPQKKYPIIHIAGTNGKGSVCYYLSQLLIESGYKVGLTLSPHVDDFRERIQVSRPNHNTTQMISQEDLLKTHAILIDKLPSSLNLTYFEWGVLLALQYFADQKVDYAVLETGLGGRWDGTNICDSILSAITTIGYDHMDYLGDTLEKILLEKLEIVKPGSDFLFGPHDADLMALAKNHCQNRQTRFHKLADFYSQDLPGDYKTYNKNFARALGKILASRGVEIALDEDKDLKWLDLPARLEIIHQNPTILMDGAHNEQGLLALKEYLMVNRQNNYDLVFGCLSNRPFAKLAGLIKSEHGNYWARFDGDTRTTSLEVYEQVQHDWGGQVVELSKAFLDKLLHQEIKRTIVVCGSFYLCSQFRRLLNESLVG